MTDNLSEIEFTLREKSGFFNSLSSLYASGMPLGSVFRSMTSSYRTGNVHKVCVYLAEQIEAGSTLEEAVLKCRNALGAAYAALLGAGEKSGKLEDILSDICANISKQQEIRSSLINALVYPAALLFLALGAGMLLQFFIIPSFRSVSNYEITSDTHTLLVSAVIKIIFVYALVFLAASAAVLIPDIKRRVKKILSKLPLIKGILRNYYFANFFSIAALAYDAGIPAAEAVMLASSVIGIEEAQKKLQTASIMVRGGRTISKSFAMTGLFSSYALSQTAAGEESGRLDKTFKTAAKDYQRSMEDAVKVMIKLLGPAVLLVIGILTAVMLGKMFTEYYNALFSMF